MIYDRHNETHEKYVLALKSLEKHNQVAEYHKVPDTAEERAFMQETNKAVSSSSFGLNMSQEQYDIIFRS